MVSIFILVRKLEVYDSNALHPALKSVYAKFIVLWDIFSFIKTQIPDTGIQLSLQSALSCQTIWGTVVYSTQE